MRKNFLPITITFIFFFICFFLIKDSVLVSKETLKIFFESVLPTLLPFLLSIYLLLETGIVELISYFLQYLSIPIFHINGYGCIVLLTSFLTGSPFSAILISLFYQQKLLNKKESIVLAFVCFYPSFSFMYSTLGSLLNYNLSLKITMAIYLTALILLYIFACFYLEKPQKIAFKEILNKVKGKLNNFNFSLLLKETISKTFLNLAIILGTMIYFSFPLVIINKFFPKSLLSLGFFQFANSCLLIAKSNFSLYKKALQISTILSFGSLSLMMQHTSFLDKLNLKFISLLMLRILTIPLTISILLLLI